MERADKSEAEIFKQSLVPRGESLGLPLCDIEYVLTPDEIQGLYEDLQSLGSQRRADAAAMMADERKVR